jgi:hypothetical protein
VRDGNPISPHICVCSKTGPGFPIP